MYAKLIAFTSLFALAFAAPGGISNSCNTGPVSCCNSVQAHDSHDVTNLFALLGLDLGGITGQVGLTCSPVTVVGVSGNSCSAQPVCCENNNFNGLINIGCSPINLNV